jgi:hypothetical protein
MFLVVDDVIKLSNSQFVSGYGWLLFFPTHTAQDDRPVQSMIGVIQRTYIESC